MAAFHEVERLVKRIARDRDKLRSLGVVRTERTIADYVEWAVSRKLRLRLSKSTIQEGFDATDNRSNKYQIKYRMHTLGSAGFDHVLPEKFDFLICVFLDAKTYKIRSAYKIPRAVVERHLLVFKRGRSFRWNRRSKSEPSVRRVV